MTRTDIIPRDLLSVTLKYWWVLVLGMLLGSLGGWVAHRLQPPIYEGRVEFSLQIDYTRTGELSEYQQDQILQNVLSIIYSTQHINQVISSAAQQGINISYSDINNNSAIERHFSTFILRVRHSDPSMVNTILNIWSQAAMTSLDQAYQHAITADLLLTQIQAISECLTQSLSVGPTNPNCGIESQPQVQLLLDELAEKYTHEKLASLNLFPGLSFSLVKSSELPTDPSQMGRSTLMLAGLAIGLLIGILLIQFLPNLKRSPDGG